MTNSAHFPQLLNCQLLEGLPERLKAEFLDDCAVQLHDRPNAVLAQGKAARGMFIVAQGKVEVTFQGADRKRYFLFDAGPGEVLGDIEMIADRPCAATCRAMAGSIVLFCGKAHFAPFLTHEIFMRNVMRVFYDRVVRDNRIKFVDVYFSSEQKVCDHILKGTSDAEPSLQQNQDALAGQVGCSRQTLNRALGGLREAGLIVMRRGGIDVVDRAGLSKRLA